MTVEDARQYMESSHECESEQRAEYGMGAVSLGLDPHEWAPAYEGYRCADDPTYLEAELIVEAHDASLPRPVLPVVDTSEDIPF